MEYVPGRASGHSARRSHPGTVLGLSCMGLDQKSLDDLAFRVFVQTNKNPTMISLKQGIFLFAIELSTKCTQALLF